MSNQLLQNPPDRSQKINPHSCSSSRYGENDGELHSLPRDEQFQDLLCPWKHESDMNQTVEKIEQHGIQSHQAHPLDCHCTGNKRIKQSMSNLFQVKGAQHMHQTKSISLTIDFQLHNLRGIQLFGL